MADDRIRVLWLIKGLGPGGAEQLLLLSAKAGDHNAFDYRVAYVRPDKTHLVPEFEAAGVVPTRLGNGRLGWLLALRSAMANADVVHAHSPVLASAARLIQLTLAPEHRPPVVVTAHSEWSGHRLPTRWLNALTSGLDARHWAVSEQVKASFWPSVARDFEVLIHGTDTRAARLPEGTRERVRNELALGRGAFLVLTVANLRHHKDYPNLMRATKLLREQHPEVTVASVGQGPLEQELKALHQQLGLGDGFRFLGFRRDVQELMAAADAFVLGSAHEGLPVAIMEAFAAGLPVVATRVGGVPQQVREGVEGDLVPPGDPQALANALGRLVVDPGLRAQMGAASLARAGDYDIRAALRVQEDAYRDLTSRRGPDASPK